MGVSENSVPLNPMAFMIIIPMKNGYFIGNIPNIFKQSHITTWIILLRTSWISFAQNHVGIPRIVKSEVCPAESIWGSKGYPSPLWWNSQPDRACGLPVTGITVTPASCRDWMIEVIIDPGIFLNKVCLLQKNTISSEDISVPIAIPHLFVCGSHTMSFLLNYA